MKPSFEQTLVDVWRQVLVENASEVKLGGKRYAVRILFLMETKCGRWSKTRIRNHVGHSWHGLARK
jgi:hypothetical protein